MKSLGMSGTSSSLGSDMDRGPVSYIFHTIVLMLVMYLEFLQPCTA
jgi:hypothetical protein